MAPSFSKLSAAILVVASVIVDPAQAFWRMPCRTRTGLARIDPLVDYGRPSKHAHAIHGNGNFNMHSDNSTLLNDNPCTSCSVKEDASVYWTPALYFEHADGSTEVVEQVGGMLAYYLLFKNEGEEIKSFPEGFGMIAGDNERTDFPTNLLYEKPKSEWAGDDVSQKNLEAKALGFNCMNYANPPEGTLMRHQMPSKEYLDANCANGVRLELFFPSCWNGKDATVPDNKAHVRFPSTVNGGTCPEGFETRIPSLLYETIWDTYAFKGKPGRFLFSNGDETGNSYHGDFMMGWDTALLQKAIDTCTNESGNIEDCSIFTIQSDEDCAKCTLETPPELKGEDCAGPRNGLCGERRHYKPKKSKPETYDEGPVLYNEKPAPKPKMPETYPDTFEQKQHAPPPHKPKYNKSKPVKEHTRKIKDVAEPSSYAPAEAKTTPPAVYKASEDQEVVSTRTYTSDGCVYEVVIVEEEETVTATSTATYTEPPTYNRRHLNAHNHRHAH